MGLAFEWDENKADQNLRRHGVGFVLACSVFMDHFAVDRIDDRMNYGEERWVRVGMVKSGLLLVVYTERNEAIRIISARRATPNEQCDYYRQNGS